MFQHKASWDVIWLSDLCYLLPLTVMSQPALLIEDISSESCYSKSVWLDLDTIWQRKSCFVTNILRVMNVLYVFFQLQCIYTVGHKKTCHFIWDHNSHVSWWIFTLLVPMETGKSIKICNFTTIVSLHYLSMKFKNTHNSTFWNQLSVYFKLNAINCKNESKWTVSSSC